MNIILASKSPRRRELLTMLGLEFDVIPAVGEENVDESLTPGETVMSLALGKAREIAEQHPGSLVIGSDTLVYLDGKPMGKPSDEAEAANMLRQLSGRVHQVFTGVAVIHEGVEKADFEKTDVQFRELTEEEIKWYIGTKEPMDKAGSYGIQGQGAVFIPGISGDYFNVMGLPLCKLWSMLPKVQGE
ncbi:MAG: septum formation inhibitor Maf [Ruminococcaceae bacterium]|nr:septum formation inhibitor Maf [Oscillospiraceae bacterium]